jgi:hypothetical protein
VGALKKESRMKKLKNLFKTNSDDGLTQMGLIVVAVIVAVAVVIILFFVLGK